MQTLQKYFAPLALVLAVVAVWYAQNATIGKLRSQLKDAEQRAELAGSVAASATASQIVVTNTVDRIVEVKVKGDKIVEKVPVYVTKEADSKCVVTNGAVSMLDSAARNVLLPGDPNYLQGANSGIALSQLTGTAAQWAGLYWQLRTRYDGLLKWTEEQGAICRNGGQK
jgi:hypothetical protein